MLEIQSGSNETNMRNANAYEENFMGEKKDSPSHILETNFDKSNKNEDAFKEKRTYPSTQIEVVNLLREALHLFDFPKKPRFLRRKRSLWRRKPVNV